MGRAFVRAINERNWSSACGLQVPRPDCQTRTQREFEGATFTLLEPGEYSSGDDVTDNVTRYAIESDGGSRTKLAYYEVIKWGNDFRVRIEVEVQR